MKLTDKFGLDEKERAGRLAFLDYDAKDSERLRSIHPLAQQHANELIDLLYEHLLSFDQTRAFFSNPHVLERVKGYQKEYFVQLTEGRTDEAYFENRLKVGDTHQRIELLPQWYLGLYSKYFGLIVDQITKHEGEGRALEVIPSLMKLIFLDIGLGVHDRAGHNER